ncbi:MAG: type II toxin-antitoxin system RelE/ParE family toxin [Acidobacteriota bacterium]|nr:type II toxin-antitoxin system RelE/ParE family toxin [Acidobacteriota bacterium]MDH3786865.1 type II toxin-antitoxin system RelE/ParE family toxin [Acidobacteriota bacterium]
MTFIETSVFTRQIKNLLSADEYQGLQLALLLRPEQGALIPNSGGLRKIRWRRQRGGKRGGIRTIYYWHGDEEVCYLLLAYSKTKRDDLTARQLKILREIALKEFK